MLNQLNVMSFSTLNGLFLSIPGIDTEIVTLPQDFEEVDPRARAGPWQCRPSITMFLRCKEKEGRCGNSIHFQTIE